MIDLSLSPLETRIVGRDRSFFATDLESFSTELSEMLRGARLLFIGAAGSIGFQTLKTVASFAPKALHVIDHNENGLAELVRALRSCASAS